MLQGFIGSSQHNLDDKGRINLPVKVRDVLSRKYDERLVITRSARATLGALDSCLHVYPGAEFEQLLARLDTLPASDPAVVLFKRRVVSNAEECNIDKQGRVLLPSLLREQAGLQDKVVLVGNANILELWSAEAWARAQQNVDEGLLAQQARLSELGL